MKDGSQEEFFHIMTLWGAILVEFTACIITAKSLALVWSWSPRAVEVYRDISVNWCKFRTYGFMSSSVSFIALTHCTGTSHCSPLLTLSLSSYKNQCKEWFGVCTSSIQWYVQPMMDTEAGPDANCVKPFIAPIAIKEKRLLRHLKNDEGLWVEDSWVRRVVIWGGRGGNSGTIVCPLLQQKVRSSPVKSSTPQYWHVLLHIGECHLDLKDKLKLCHHWFSSSSCCTEMESDRLVGGTIWGSESCWLLDVLVRCSLLCLWNIW